ncbi:hypothetical protein SAMN04489761_1702 [Tenacibaculum sp. MAR_2009_124]|nr:hypothetical protein SAMN04489761_1702 [Tenacibaculum sp. MAR_2009_124]
MHIVTVKSPMQVGFFNGNTFLKFIYQVMLETTAKENE